MPIETRLTRQLKIQHPIILAPMDPAAGGRLANAVSNAGGLGLIGGGYGDAERIEREFREAGNARIGRAHLPTSVVHRTAAQRWSSPARYGPSSAATILSSTGQKGVSETSDSNPWVPTRRALR